MEDQYFVAVKSEMTLQRAGFECVGLVNDAGDAFEVAREARPDLILMDIRFAGSSDGVKAATAIYRELGIRCIFASGHADSRTRHEARDARPLGWLDKPYGSAELVAAVTRGLAELDREDHGTH